MDKLKEIIEEVLEKDIEIQLSENVDLRNDLGFDSLKLAQLTVFIEDEFDVDIFENGNISTIGEILIQINDD